VRSGTGGGLARRAASPRARSPVRGAWTRSGGIANRWRRRCAESVRWALAGVPRQCSFDGRSQAARVSVRSTGARRRRRVSVRRGAAACVPMRVMMSAPSTENGMMLNTTRWRSRRRADDVGRAVPPVGLQDPAEPNRSGRCDVLDAVEHSGRRRRRFASTEVHRRRPRACRGREDEHAGEPDQEGRGQRAGRETEQEEARTTWPM